LGDFMRRLGELLVDQGLLTDLELDAALRYQEAHYFPLGEIVVGQGYVSRPALARALASQRERDLEFEGGFGSGLFALLDERHALRRSLEFERAAR
jgi:hypothetical protein